jgi:hypothetical protein
VPSSKSAPLVFLCCVLSLSLARSNHQARGEAEQGECVVIFSPRLEEKEAGMLRSTDSGDGEEEETSIQKKARRSGTFSVITGQSHATGQVALVLIYFAKVHICYRQASGEREEEENWAPAPGPHHVSHG